MDLGSLAAGASVFVDANTLVYHFSSQVQFGPACRQFVERVARLEVQAFSSSHVASDVAHRMMTVEAITTLGWPLAGIAQRLKRQHGEIAKMRFHTWEFKLCRCRTPWFRQRRALVNNSSCSVETP